MITKLIMIRPRRHLLLPDRGSLVRLQYVGIGDEVGSVRSEILFHQRQYHLHVQYLASIT